MLVVVVSQSEWCADPAFTASIVSPTTTTTSTSASASSGSGSGSSSESASKEKKSAAASGKESKDKGKGKEAKTTDTTAATSATVGMPSEYAKSINTQLSALFATVIARGQQMAAADARSGFGRSKMDTD